tara:strand:+ start:117 stop:731 length:615 start_codon:yes stop_codon:yes gene_type:complete
MMHKIVLYLFLGSALFGQFNHQDKLGIKRKLGQSTVTFDFDGRTNETGFFHKHLDIGIHYSFKPTWTVGLKYRAQYRTKENEWHLEQRPQGELIKVMNSQKLKWQFRTRMDYRIREGKNDEMRNRSRIQLKALSPISLLKITPFISNEFFFAPKSWNYYINWTAIGFDLPKTKIGKPTIFYKYVQTLNDDKWTPTYTMVFKLMI